MSIRQQVADKVIELGSARLHDLVPLFPHLTEKQIGKAIDNACAHRLIQLKKRGAPLGRYKGQERGTYGPYEPPAQRSRPIASVWELGQCRL